MKTENLVLRKIVEKSNADVKIRRGGSRRELIERKPNNITELL